MNEIGLYRLPDDVKEEILKAVNSWRINSPFKIDALVERALRDLELPYSKLNFEEREVKVIKVVSEVPLKLPENISFKNGLTAFQEHLEKLIIKVPEAEKPIIKKILDSFKKLFEGI